MLGSCPSFIHAHQADDSWGDGPAIVLLSQIGFAQCNICEHGDLKQLQSRQSYSLQSSFLLASGKQNCISLFMHLAR